MSVPIQFLRNRSISGQMKFWYQLQTNGYLERHRKARERVTELEGLKRKRQSKSLILDGFIKGLESRPTIIDEFDEQLWTVMVNKVIVLSDNSLNFKFKDGTEIIKKKTP